MFWWTMNIKIGRLYKRAYENKFSVRSLSDLDIIVVTGVRVVENEPVIEFFYVDDPEEICVWNEEAFKNGMVEMHENRV